MTAIAPSTRRWRKLQHERSVEGRFLAWRPAAREAHLGTNGLRPSGRTVSRVSSTNSSSPSSLRCSTQQPVAVSAKAIEPPSFGSKSNSRPATTRPSLAPIQASRRGCPGPQAELAQEVRQVAVANGTERRVLVKRWAEPVGAAVRGPSDPTSRTLPNRSLGSVQVNGSRYSGPVTDAGADHTDHRSGVVVVRIEAKRLIALARIDHQYDPVGRDVETHRHCRRLDSGDRVGDRPPPPQGCQEHGCRDERSHRGHGSVLDPTPVVWSS